MLPSLPTTLWAALLVHIAIAQNSPSLSSSPNLEKLRLERRAGFRIPGKGVADDIDSPSPGGGLRDDLGPGSISPGRIGSDSPGSGTGPSGGAGRYRPPRPIVRNPSDPSDNTALYGGSVKTYNPCFRDREDCLEMADVAVDLTDKIIEAASDEDAQSTKTSADEPTAASSSSTRRVGATGQTFAMPNVNMSDWMSGRSYQSVFTENEIDLLKSDPLCFFATYERIYRYMAPLAKSSTTSEETRGPEPTESTRAGGSDCPLSPGTCESPGDRNEEAKELYLSYLPSQISMVYLSTPTEVTLVTTKTTTCPEFRIDEMKLRVKAFTTEYGVFGFREGMTPSPTAVEEQPPVQPSGEIKSFAVRGVSCARWAAAFGLVATLAMVF